MNVGDEFTFAATVSPDNADNKSVVWSSSVTSVMIIDASGKAKALAAGQSVIKVTTEDGGKTDLVTVTVVNPVVDVTAIEITSKPASNKMTVGDSFTFAAKVSPDNATDKTLKWTSSNTGVISIDSASGKATAKNAGNSTITATSANGKVKASVSITVAPEEPSGNVTGVTLSTENNVNFVRHGKTLQIIPSYSPAGAYPASSKWYSSNEKLMTVDQNGLVKGVGFEYSQTHLYYTQNGYPKAKITHQADNSVSVIEIEIRPALVEKIVVENPAPATMYVGETWRSGKITTLPEEAEDGWASFGAYNNVSEDGSGEIVFTAKEPGKFGISIDASGQHSSLTDNSIQVHYSIEVLPIKETSMKLSRNTYTVEAGSFFDLTYAITPVDATYKDATWTSSNTSVATVDKNGRVSAKSAGSATITATSHHGLKVSCNVSVKSKSSSVKIGDYYYSDGTTSSELQSGKTPVGVVFAVADAVGSDPVSMGKDHSGCVNGLVVGLESYNTPIAKSAFIDDYPLNVVAANAVNAGMIDMTDRTTMCGYSNTKAMRNWGSWMVLDVCSSHSSAYPLPSTTSGWYFPSLGELELLGDAYSQINDKLTAINSKYGIKAGLEFWVSTFFGNASNSFTYVISAGALYADIHEGAASGAPMISSTSKYARFIFAF